MIASGRRRAAALTQLSGSLTRSAAAASTVAGASEAAAAQYLA